MRVFECPLCYKISSGKSSSSHILRKCTKFQNYKQNLTKTNYIGSKLNLSDSIGFCSAGIIPWFVDSLGAIHLLGLYETRDSTIKINFVGGGREGNMSRLKQSVRMETPTQTALGEFSEEMGQMVESPELLNSIRECLIRKLRLNKYKTMWISSSKMVYYLVQVPKFISNEIPGKLFNEKQAQSYCKTVGFEWFKLNELTNVNNKYNQVHEFTKPIVKLLENNQNEIFV